jgi:mRNA interferase RelE/StbE
VPYEIVVAPKAKRDLAAPPHNALSKIDPNILSLASNPRPVGSKKLKGLENVFRIRVGDYRIVYQIEDKRLIVLVVRVGHRKDIYKGL